MEFELNLIENSYDYLNESLGYYKNIGYYETHNPEIDSIEEKRKWKTTFVLLVQATELLLKEKLFRINPLFLYEDIDCTINNKSKTITFSKSVNRLRNINSTLLDPDEQKFLLICANIRNDCIHYTVKLNSIDIKRKYCKLFELYIKLHSRFFNKKYLNDKYNEMLIQILDYAKGFEVYRGSEFSPKDLKKVKKNILLSQKNEWVYNKKQAFVRTKYGEEPIFLNRKFGYRIIEDSMNIYQYSYCGDCLAAQGEFHDRECDLEICPNCGKQLITCSCFDGYCSTKEVDKKGLDKYI